jgi:transposase
MAHDTLFVSLDVHKDSITAACVGTDHPALPVDLGSFGTQQYAIDRLMKKLSGRGPLRFVYEAGPCGFWLQRYPRRR